MAVVRVVGGGMVPELFGSHLPPGLVAQPLLEGLIDNGPVAGLLW
jgi:hypothetical protein